MATSSLPTRTDYPHYSFSVDLDGTPYVLDFDWNERAGSWALGVSLVDGTVLVAGRRIVVGYPLLNRFKDPRLPRGVLMAMDTSNQDADPGEAELGARVQLVYIDAADLAEIEA